MNDHPRKKILILTSTFPRWQDDNEPPFVYLLCKGLMKTYDCKVLSPGYPDSKTYENMDGIEVHRFRYFLKRWQTLAYEGGILAKLKNNRLRYSLIPFFLLSELLHTILIVNGGKIDLIHAHWLIPQGLIAIIARKLSGKDIPILCTLHGGDLYSLNGKFLDSLKRYVLNNVDAITVVSSTMKSYLSRYNIPENKINIIPMGVDLTHTFLPDPSIPRTPGSILFVGRLVDKKGVDYLLQAFHLIANKYPHAYLNIAGSGPDRKLYEDTATNLGIEARVKFLGQINNAQLPSLYNRHSVIVFPSVVAESGDQEGFGLVLVEALGCECTAITTDLKAMRDIVTDSINAIIIPQKDPIAIASAIEKVFDDDKFARSLGIEGRKSVVNRFDWSRISGKYRELIAHIITD